MTIHKELSQVDTVQYNDNLVQKPTERFKPLSQTSKCALVAFIIIALAGAVMMGLGGYGVFGTMGSMTYIISTTVEGALTFASLIAILAITIKHYMAKQKTTSSDRNTESMVNSRSTQLSGPSQTTTSQNSVQKNITSENQTSKKQCWNWSLAVFSLFVALRSNDLEKVKTEIAKHNFGEDLLKEAKKDGKLPIHCAAENGNISMLEFLISKGVDINAQTDNGDTAFDLFLMSTLDDPKVVEFMIQKGFSKNLNNQEVLQ